MNCELWLLWGLKNIYNFKLNGKRNKCLWVVFLFLVSVKVGKSYFFIFKSWKLNKHFVFLHLFFYFYFFEIQQQRKWESVIYWFYIVVVFLINYASSLKIIQPVITFLRCFSRPKENMKKKRGLEHKLQYICILFVALCYFKRKENYFIYYLNK